MGFRFFLKAKFFSLAILFVVFLSSCNEDPSSLGYSFIKDTVEIISLNSDDTQLIGNAIPFRKEGSINNAGALLLGKSEFAKSVCILRASPVDTLGYVEPEDITGVAFTFYPQRYALGDTLDGYFGFDVKEVMHAWTFDANYDSLMVSPADYFGNEILASHEGLVTYDDTLGATPLVMNMQKDLIAEWLQTWGKRLDGDTIPVWGIGLVPHENTNILYQFSAQGSGRNPAAPYNFMTVFFKNKDNEPDTLKLYFSIESCFPDGPFPEENAITLQGGIVYNTQLLFDVGMIPTLAGVQKAKMELTLDRSRSKWGNLGLSEILRCELLDEKESDDYIAFYEGYKDTTRVDKYVFNSVSSAVTHWQRIGGSGFLVFKPSTFQSVFHQSDRYVFYGPDAEDPENRPKIIIIYSKLSEEQN